MRKSQGSSWLKISIQQGGMLLLVFALRLGFGFLLAGPAGLSFFGRNYTRSLDRFVSDADKPSSAPQETAPEAKATQVPESSEQAELVQASSETQGFFEVFLLQALGQYALVLFLAGLPLILGIRALKTVVSAKQPVGKQSAFVILVALLAIVMIPAVAAFQGLVATLGENTDERVISRHYEFLIPLFILAGLSLMKFVEPSKTSRLIQATVILIASAYSAIWLSGFIIPKFSDSSILMGMLFSNTIFYLLVTVVVVSVGLWAFEPIKTLNFTSFALVPLVFISTGLMSQARLYENTGVDKADFDVAGQVSNPLLAGVSGGEIVVVGLFRPSLITAKFWIDLPRVADAVIETDGKDVSNIISPYSYALIIGGSTVSIAHEVLATGEGYQLVRIEK
jgi:phosphoglycerol transferase